MSVKSLSCCDHDIKCGDVWLLQDFKGYTARKLYIGTCDICGDEACLQVMTSVNDGKVYYNLYNGIEAVKTIYREKKRKVAVFPDVKSSELYGWIYGKNIEIKNKKGQITQIRQYSADFYGKKKLLKQLYL